MPRIQPVSRANACPEVGKTLIGMGTGSSEEVMFQARDAGITHACAVDGVFEEVAGGDVGDVGGADDKASPSNVIFHPAIDIDAAAVAQGQAILRRRILRAFPGRGLLDSCDAKGMLGYHHSGFCEPSFDKRGVRVDELHLPPLELIERTAALVPPPRTHRHHYFGVLAPNSSLRNAVTALAAPVQPATTGESAATVAAPSGNAHPPIHPRPSLCHPSAQRRITCGPY